MFDALGAAPHQAVHLGRDPGTVIAVLCTRNFRRSPPLARIQEALEAQAPLHMYEMDLLAQRHSNDEDVAEMVALE